MKSVYVVTGFDVGGNSGATIEGVFTEKSDAEHYAQHSPNRVHNLTFWPGTGAAFEVEEYDLNGSLDVPSPGDPGPLETRWTLINGRWGLYLPLHRHLRDSWPWWEATRLAAMHAVIKPGMTVVDVGAEEGDFPALWASWGAQVVMAEPNPRVWPNIRTIWEANELPAPAGCWCGFLGDTVTPFWEAHVADPPGAWPDSADGPVIGDHGFCQLGERPDLPTTTVDALLALTGVRCDVLTMDVEGSEAAVLSGSIGTLMEDRPVVFVSIHPEFMEHHYGIRDGVDFIRGFMTGSGYRDQFLCVDHEHHWAFFPEER